MEAKWKELLDEKLFENRNTTEEHLPDDKLNEFLTEINVTKKTVEELEQDREKMNVHLNELKKENFKLEASVKAWKTTLENKLEEFKEADLKLDGIYNEIRTEREEFCSKVDKFNNEYGILSEWWEKQMNFVSELENLEQKNTQEQKCKREIKQLEEDIEDIKKQIELLQAEKQQQVTEVEVHSTPEDSPPSVRSREPLGDVSPERVDAKKIRVAEPDDRIEVCEENESELAKTFYSLVDVEKVRMVTRRNRQRAFLTKIKKLLK